MARGRGKGRAGKANLLSSYGYPKQVAIGRQAHQYAEGAVPTIGAVTRPYNRSLQDVGGFTSALSSILQGLGKTVGSGYDKALSQQHAIDTASQARLADLGPQYAGAANAVASNAGSGMTSLVQQAAAARQAAAQQPGIAASRGQLMALGIANARTDALKGRQDSLRQAYLQALPQVQQNALAMAQTNASLFQNDRQFREAQRQFNGQFMENSYEFRTNLGWQKQQAAIQDAQFNASQSQQWKEFLIEQARLAKSAGTGPGAKFTPLQIQHFQSDSFDAGQSAIRHGIPVQKFISDGVGHGIPKSVMIVTASRIYGGIPATRFTDPAVKQRARAAYQSYVQWMQSKQWTKYKKHSPQGSRNQRNPNPRGAGSPPGPKGPRNQRNPNPPGARG